LGKALPFILRMVLKGNPIFFKVQDHINERAQSHYNNILVKSATYGKMNLHVYVWRGLGCDLKNKLLLLLLLSLYNNIHVKSATYGKMNIHVYVRRGPRM